MSLLLAHLDASHFGVVPARKHLTCVEEAEGVAAFLSPGVAELRPPWAFSSLLLGPSLGWSLRGKGCGAWLRCGAANGLAQPGWTRTKKDAGCGPIGCTIPHLQLPASSARIFQW